MYSEAQGISQCLSQGKVGEEGKELELGSLFWRVEIDSHTMEISGSLGGKDGLRLPAVQFTHCLNGQKAVYPGSEHTCLGVQM